MSMLATYYSPMNRPTEILPINHELLSPSIADLWFVPLGGCGEIGSNLNLYGHDGQWLIVDCGIGCDREPGAEAVITPDPVCISARRESLVGIVITQAHEEHVGVVVYLWT